jgi:lauroyl/myristoyl acyltransferase
MKHLDDLRRRVTRGAAAGALRVAGALGSGPARSLGVALGRFAHLVPALRERLADNLRAAGMDASDATVKAYFRRLGVWVGHSLSIYGGGFDRSAAGAQIELDPDTVHHLDAAVAKGKGVVSPHLFCHEIGGALIHRRHPVTALVRESKDPGWAAIKQRWYGESLGLQTVLRPRKGSLAGDSAALLRVLRDGRVLGITPDVLTSRTSGLPVTLFNRTVSLSPGMILLAMRSGAPLITAGGRWFADPVAPNRERAVVTFSEPLDLPRGGDRESALRDGLQRWCLHFEATLRRSPADWQFWLDKGWTKVLRQPATVPMIRRAA